MKKRLVVWLSVLMTLCMLAPTTVFAAENAPSAPEQIMDIREIDIDTVPDADSYTVTNGADTLLEVVHETAIGRTAALSQATGNGFYTAEFMIPETNDKAFLSGLTRDNADEIRQAIVASYTEGADFDLKNLGFIDAEKTWAEDGDDSMCWAAASANVLTYTGWAAQAGFNSTDDLFETLIDSFTDEGGSFYCAAAWFFDGIDEGYGFAQMTPGTGAYLPDYDYGDLVDVINLDTDIADNLSVLYRRLYDGCGAVMGVDIYGAEGYEGGHSITCWGFVTDIRYPETDLRHYKSVFITDSDSDKYSVQGDLDRRDADDVMSLFSLDVEEQDGTTFLTFDITDVQRAVVNEALTLRPYGADLPFETSSDATRDLSADPDIRLDPFYLTDDSSVGQTKTTFAPGSEIYYQPYMMNYADVDYVGPLKLTVTVTDADGNVQYTRTFNYSSVTISPSYGLSFGCMKITKTLPVGDYTITASFNPSHDVTEAYFYNNTRSIGFKVRESYLLGDADNDGSLSVVDATLMKRKLAQLSTSLDENAGERSDINQSGDLDLLDATLLERHLTGMEILYDIEVTRFYQ